MAKGMRVYAKLARSSVIAKITFGFDTASSMSHDIKSGIKKCSNAFLVLYIWVITYFDFTLQCEGWVLQGHGYIQLYIKIHLTVYIYQKKPAERLGRAVTSEDLCLAKRLLCLPPPSTCSCSCFTCLLTGEGRGWLLGEPLRPARCPGRKTVMDGGWPPLLLLTCWLGPMRYSWDLGQERDAKRFKNILRNSLRCQPSCQVVLSKESQALHPCTHMQSGGIRSRSFFNLLLSHSRLENTSYPLFEHLTVTIPR